jgi:hypothetical protein
LAAGLRKAFARAALQQQQPQQQQQAQQQCKPPAAPLQLAGRPQPMSPRLALHLV